MEEKQQTKPAWKRTVVYSFAGVALLWALSTIVIVFVSDSPERRGQFGDMFGAVNALFSGLAFAGLIVAILMQREELQLQREDIALQRKELELTRAELAGQKEQMALQNETLRRQQFESTFFQMLQVFFDYVDEIGTNNTARSSIFRDYKDRVYAGLFGVFLEIPRVERSKLLTAYSDCLGDEESILGPYFRLLYNIIKFIDSSEIEDKRFYTNIVRASLSMDELVLIFLNGADRGRNKFKPLIEKYTLLKHLDKDQQFDSLLGKHRDVFAETAYVKEQPKPTLAC